VGAYNFRNPTTRTAMARPVTTGTTPPKIRTAKSKQALLEAGGKRKPFNLSAASLADITKIRARFQLRTDTDAAVIALAVLSGRAKSIDEAMQLLNA